MKKYLYCWEIVLLLILALEMIVFGIINPRFLDLSNLLYSTGDFAYIGMVALPLTLIIITGGIDISFAATIGLCAIVFGISNHAGWPLYASISASLCSGLVAGLFNAAIIYFSGIQALVVTLGSMYLFAGLATVLSGSIGAGGFEGIGNFPASFTDTALFSLAGLPLPSLILIAMAALLTLLLHASLIGRRIFLCGLNPEAAKFSGISTNKISFICYGLLGFCAAIAGLSMSAYYGSARVDLGNTALLPAITAVVLGGASIYGGKGSIIGTLIATLIIGYLQQGLQMSGVTSQISTALSGALLIIAVALRQGGHVISRVFRKHATQMSADTGTNTATT